jgi:predicted small lipoprotein YifL
MTYNPASQISSGAIMRSSFILFIIAIPVLLLEGCGHKGPLMLPSPPPGTAHTQEIIAPASGVPVSRPGNQP